MADARTAYAARDAQAMAEAYEQALRLRPQSPNVMYNLAIARSWQSRPQNALLLLEALRRKGLWMPAGEDPDFFALQAMPAFESVLAGFEENLRPVGKATRAFAFDVPNALAEGIAVDAESGVAWLSLVNRRRILKREADGRVSDFADAQRNGLWAAQGMRIDPSRDLLWAASSALPEADAATTIDRDRSGLWAFALADGEMKRRVMLPRDGRSHALGDLVVTADGALIASDSLDGQLYRLNPGTDHLVALVPPGTLVSPQGLALSADGETLFVADYAQGLFRMDPRGGTPDRVTVPDAVCDYGIDGLDRDRDGLIAVQNGIRPARVVRWRLDAANRAIVAERVLLQGHPDMGGPTLGTVVGNAYFLVANSGWDRVDEHHKLPAIGASEPIRVLRLQLR